MSIVPRETIQVIGQSIGINNLSDDVAAGLAPDVEYRMREIMQEAIKCMRHSKRSVLTTEDVSTALSLRNIEPLYGFASGDPLRFRRAAGHSDLFFIDDKDLDIKEILDAPLPKPPLDAAVMAHWLAIEGIQPAIPENAPVEPLPALAGPPPELKKLESARKSPDQDLKVPVKHVLSKELQLYYDKITEVVLGGDSSLLANVLASLATDSGLHPLAIYFSQFIADSVRGNTNDVSVLYSLMRMVQSLMMNPNINLEPYLHQLMTAIVTCLVAKGLGSKGLMNHWELRDYTAKLVAFVCEKFGHPYYNLQMRITKTLLNAFLDPNKSLTQHYGAVQGIAALGSKAVRLLLLPNLVVYLRILEPQMTPEHQPNEIKRYEATRVYGALQSAAGNAIYDMLRAAKSTKKRRADTNLLQGHRKKLCKESNGTSTSTTTTVGDELVEQQQQQQHPGNVPLAEAWKEDAELGDLVTGLIDAFGAGMQRYVPMEELSRYML